jgi:nitrite reductase/ring-hydroxylating ferredoxin subunit
VRSALRLQLALVSCKAHFAASLLKPVRSIPPHPGLRGSPPFHFVEQETGVMTQMEVASAAEILEGKAHAVTLGKLSLVLTRIGGKIQAFENRCPHLGLPLVRGRIDGQSIRCPWHGSRFDICSGENLDWWRSIPGGVRMPNWTHKLIALGKKPAPLRRFEAREDRGQVYVSVPQP